MEFAGPGRVRNGRQVFERYYMKHFASIPAIDKFTGWARIRLIVTKNSSRLSVSRIEQLGKSNANRRIANPRYSDTPLFKSQPCASKHRYLFGADAQR
jgi:hypothetical protein